jgi:branched-chain amino acid transport system permease protein
MRRTSFGRDALLAGAALLILVLLPLIFPGKAFFDFIIRLSAFAIFATSLNLLIGYGGMVSFGHGLFFGLGAYSFALMRQNLNPSIPVAFVLTLQINGSVATGVGAICIRLKEIYFAFLTLAFQMLLYSLIIAWTDVTGGDQGLTGGVPRPPFLGIRLDDPHHLYLFCVSVLVISLLLMRHVLQTPFGYTLRMTRDNPARCGFLGIRIWRVRLLAFVVAGLFGGVGGVLMSLYVSSAYPDFAYWTISGEAVFMILLGGMNVFLGPLTGAVVLLLLNDIVTGFTQHYGLVLGIVILAFALGLRKGVLGTLSELWSKRTLRPRDGNAAPEQAKH